jgi:hypothetical protein
MSARGLRGRMDVKHADLAAAKVEIVLLAGL